MKDNSAKIKRILLFLVLVILIIPLIQSRFSIFKLPQLKGAIAPPEEKQFNIKDWLTGDYQENQEKCLNETFGFRSFFIRINNQLAYSIFNKAKANGVIIGKKNYLFEENYIKAYYGTDFIGNDSITHRMQRLKFVSDTLAKQNKTLILVFAAGKGSFYPEYFPDKYKTERKTTNYEKHVELAQKYQLNYIDFNKYFVDQKSTSKYPLYPQYGIHWSYYGSCLAADSIVRYIEKARNIDMPNMYWDKVDMDTPRGDDADIANGMNIIFRPKSFKMAYPQLQFQTDEGKTKPSVLVVSDSFYWALFGIGISNSFKINHFWFYNKEIYPESGQKKLDTDQVDLEEEIKKHDVFIILGTEATLPGFGWGFIEDTYNLYKKGIKKKSILDPEIQKKISEIRNYIKSDEKWMKEIERKAAVNKVSVDSMITVDAIWILKDRREK